MWAFYTVTLEPKNKNHFIKQFVSIHRKVFNKFVLYSVCVFPFGKKKTFSLQFSSSLFTLIVQRQRNTRWCMRDEVSIHGVFHFYGIEWCVFTHLLCVIFLEKFSTVFLLLFFCFVWVREQGCSEKEVNNPMTVCKWEIGK